MKLPPEAHSENTGTFARTFEVNLDGDEGGVAVVGKRPPCRAQTRNSQVTELSCSSISMANPFKGVGVWERGKKYEGRPLGETVEAVPLGPKGKVDVNWKMNWGSAALKGAGRGARSEGKVKEKAKFRLGTGK